MVSILAVAAASISAPMVTASLTTTSTSPRRLLYDNIQEEYGSDEFDDAGREAMPLLVSRGDAIDDDLDNVESISTLKMVLSTFLTTIVFQPNRFWSVSFADIF